MNTIHILFGLIKFEIFVMVLNLENILWSQCRLYETFKNLVGTTSILKTGAD